MNYITKVPLERLRLEQKYHPGHILVRVEYPFFFFSLHIFDKVILARRQVVFDQGGLLCRVYVVVYYIKKKTIGT